MLIISNRLLRLAPEDGENSPRVNADYLNKAARGNRLFTKEQRALQQEIDLRKTDRSDLKTIEDVTCWSARHNGMLPVHSREDKDQSALALASELSD